jgi:predicted transcriptional regulator
MEQIILELDSETAARLEQVAPARSRKRSEFLRQAIRRAIWDLEEQATAEAYARQPDSAERAYLDPKAWEHRPVKKLARKRRR